jgi:hypothetical protein
VVAETHCRTECGESQTALTPGAPRKRNFCPPLRREPARGPAALRLRPAADRMFAPAGQGLRLSTGGWACHGLRVHRFGLPGAGHRPGGAEGERADETRIDRPALTAQSGQSCVR